MQAKMQSKLQAQGVEKAIQGIGNSIVTKIEAIKVGQMVTLAVDLATQLLCQLITWQKWLQTENTLKAINTTLQGKFVNQ